MDWRVVIALILANAGIAFFAKKLTNGFPKFRGLFLQYFCAFFLVSLIWLVFDSFPFSFYDFALIGGGMGLLNFLGVYCQWSLFKISMSKTSLFAPLSSVVTIALFWIFYQEYQHLTWLSILGICLHFGAIYLFISKKERKQEEVGNMAKWLVLVIVWILICGLKDFLIRVFASNETPNHHFLVYYYTGSFLFSAIALLFLGGEKNLAVPVESTPKKLYIFALLSSFAIMSNQASEYWGFQVSVGSAVISLQGLNGVFIPVLIGCLLFGEAKDLSKKDILGFILGAIAAILIILC